jgi:lycopene beta-cyclase
MDADLIIVGGGCAGLSLASWLANAGPAAPRTIILEPRSQYTNDRTWCGWRGRPHLFMNSISHSWSRWTVSAAHRSITAGADGQYYDCIPADRFYDTALHAIRRSPVVRLQGGTTVSAVVAKPGQVSVLTDRGRLTAAMAIDTRPPEAAPGDGLLQSFVGFEVETAEPCFDPDTVGLMSFLPGPADTISFLYTLPFSATRALLELTWMSAAGAAPDDAALGALLQGRLGCGFTVRRRESGCLPMRLAIRQAQPDRVLRLGIAGGALRAATGYGFATIQNQAAALAHVLRGGTEAARGWQADPAPGWMQWMDRLFLNVLRRHPERAPQMLTTMFQRCPSVPLVRFLSGTGGLADAARVVLSLPPAPFLRELAWAA